MFSRDSILRGPNAVQRFLNGDRETLEAAKSLIGSVLHNFPKLSGYWDDLESKVYCSLLERLRGSGDPIQNFEGFIVVITYRRAVELWREISRWKVVPEEELKAVEDSASGPLELLEKQDDKELVDSIIASAPEIYRKIWVLRLFENLTNREAAARLGLAEGTVKWLMHQSLLWAGKKIARALAVRKRERVGSAVLN
jgi:RNA polymerase sigma factor, sigma-70 family